MVNFKDSVLGFILLILGFFLVYRTIKNKKKDFKDVYGNYISIYVGEVGLILVGMYLFFKELIKLF
jgi:uncharacterized BrkB/YihY/UPF0761 family membrane protein